MSGNCWQKSYVEKVRHTQKLPMYHMGIKKRRAQKCSGKMTIISLQGPFHKTNEQGLRLPESKNWSTVKVRFRHPNLRSVHGITTDTGGFPPDDLDEYEMIGGGRCEQQGCRCPQFTWKSFVYKKA